MRKIRQAVVFAFVTTATVLSAASRQAPSAPSFEVASVKRNTSGSGSMSVRAPGDRFEMLNGAVMTLVLNAYGLRSFQVIGAPAWTSSERSDVMRWSRDDRPNDDAPSLFTAVQEQLGLKLEPRHAPVDVLLIESVERPAPD